MDRALTRPSDVTSKSKTDANAGTTAASGFGDPVSGLVNQEKVRRFASSNEATNGSRFLPPSGSLNPFPVVPGRCGGEWSE